MSGFLNRWSKRKTGVEAESDSADLTKEQSSVELKKTADASKGSKDINAANLGLNTSAENGDLVQSEAKSEEAAPTLDDVLKLTQDSDFSAYVKPGIDPEVQKAAMQKLFSDPRYNIMDGLDIYIDDYSKPDPIPLEMLKKLNQSHMLGLFKTPEEKLAEEELERIERKGYYERLKVIEDKELADGKEVLSRNIETDESPSAIGTENSAKSTELTDSQESEELKTETDADAEIKPIQTNPADKAD